MGLYEKQIHVKPLLYNLLLYHPPPWPNHYIWILKIAYTFSINSELIGFASIKVKN
jgi:hypothetical protein